MGAATIDGVVVQWEWEGDQGKWTGYNSKHAATITDSYNNEDTDVSTNHCAVKVESKVGHVILSPPATETSHTGLMRQFELYAIMTLTYSTDVHCCMPSKWKVVAIYLIPRQASERLVRMARNATCTDTEIRSVGFEPSTNQYPSVGNRHSTYH